MMSKREIYFRGKKVNDNEWVYGNAQLNIGLKEEDEVKDYILDIHGSVWEIDRMTLGQYIGLCDRHPNKIYEDDIIEIGVQRSRYLVVFSRPHASFMLKQMFDDIVSRKGNLWPFTDFSPLFSYEYADIIGNVHDNKDLL